MDFYKNVSGDVRALKVIDSSFCGMGQDTASRAVEKISQASKSDKIEPNKSNISPFLKTEYEIFTDYHEMLKRDYVSIQMHFRSVMEHKKDVTSIAKLTELAQRHNCSNIGELYITKGDDPAVMKGFAQFSDDLKRNLKLKQDFNKFAECFESMRYSLENCNKLSGINETFTMTEPNPQQLSFITNAHQPVNEVLRSYRMQIADQTKIIDQLKELALQTAFIAIPTNDRNVFSQAASEVHAIQNPKYNDLLALTNNEMAILEEQGRNLYTDHLAEVQKLNNDQNMVELQKELEHLAPYGH